MALNNFKCNRLMPLHFKGLEGKTDRVEQLFVCFCVQVCQCRWETRHWRFMMRYRSLMLVKNITSRTWSER